MGETEALAQFSAAPGPPGLELPRVEPPDLRVSTVPTCHAAPVGHSPSFADFRTLQIAIAHQDDIVTIEIYDSMQHIVVRRYFSQHSIAHL